MDVLIRLIMEIILLPIGFFFGGSRERKHMKSLAVREATNRPRIQVNNFKHVRDPDSVEHATMLIGQVVIATDHYKTFVTRVRSFFGGEMRAMQRLLERGRREALQRLIEQSLEQGASELWNVRLGSSSVSAMSVEVIAYGTAVRRKAAS